MPRSTNTTKKSKGVDSRKLSALINQNSAKLWNEVTLDNLKSFLLKFDPSCMATIHKNHVSVLCRIHNDSKPSFHIYPQKRYGICYACTGSSYTNDIIELLMPYTKLSKYETLMEFQKYYNLKIFKKTDRKNIELYEQHNQMKINLQSIFHKVLSKAMMFYINAPDKTLLEKTDFHFAIEACEYLIKRGVADVIPFAPNIGVMPTLPVMQQCKVELLISDYEFEEILKYCEPLLKSHLLGNLVFAYNTSPDRIGQFKLRKPCDEKKIYTLTDPYEENMGLFGLSMFKNTHDISGSIGNTNQALVTEGEFDQLQMANQQIANSCIDWIVLAHGGSSNYDLQQLKKYGIHNCFYVPDFDAGGIHNAAEILRNNQDLNIRIFEWPLTLTKGPEESVDLDTSIVRCGFSLVNAELNNKDLNFRKPEIWAEKQCREEIREKNIEDDEKALVGTIASWSECLGRISDDESEHSAFLESWVINLLEKYGIHARDAKNMAARMVAEDDPETLFALKLKEQLLVRFSFLCVEANPNGRFLYIWDRDKKILDKIKSNSDADIKAYFGNNIGSWLDWGTRKIGFEPDIIKYGGVLPNPEQAPPPKSRLKREEYISGLGRLELRNIIQEVSNQTNMLTKTAGNHYLDVDDEGKILFVCNGKRVFKGIFDKKEELIWEELTEPKYRNIFFNIKGEELYTPHILKLEDLTKAPEVSLVSLYRKSLKVLRQGWSFRHQEEDTLLNAAIPLYLPICKAFRFNIQMFASGERNSGKTTLVARLLGGNSVDCYYRLGEHTITVDSATPAGIRQRMSGNPRSLFVDELDDTDKSNSTDDNNSSIYKIMRLSYGGGTHLQGTSDGDATTKDLNFSTFFAGIDPKLTDANRSRLMQIDLVGNDRKISPDLSLQMFEDAEPGFFNTFRKQLSCCLFRYIPKLIRKHTTIVSYFARNPDLTELVNQRYLDSFCVLLTIMAVAQEEEEQELANGAVIEPEDLLNLDWKMFGPAYWKLKSTHFEKVKTATEYHKLWVTILATPNIILNGMETVSRTTCINELIKRPEELYKINECSMGIKYYYDDKEKRSYLVVHWMQIRVGLLRLNPMLSYNDNTNLKDKADRHPNAVTEAEKLQNMARIAYLDGWVTNVSDYSALEITDLLENIKERQTVSVSSK